jgi:hypothetical protein
MTSAMKAADAAAKLEDDMKLNENSETPDAKFARIAEEIKKNAYWRALLAGTHDERVARPGRDRPNSTAAAPGTPAAASTLL